jgi:PAS domain S-box-containing protein
MARLPPVSPLPELVESSEDDPRIKGVWFRGLSMDEIRSSLPGHFEMWARHGVVVALVGYVAVSVAHLGRGVGLRAWAETLEPAVIAVLLVSMALVRAGRHLLSVQVALTAIWVQMIQQLAWSPEGIRGTSLPVLLLIIVAVNLLLGPNASFGVTVATTVAVPATLVVGGALLEGSRGLPVEDWYLLFAFVVTSWGGFVLLTSFLGAFWEVTVRSRTNELRFAAMVDGAPDAIVGLGPDGLVDVFNPAAERALGLPAAEAIGKPFSVLPIRAVSGNALETHSGPRELEVEGSGTLLESMVRRIPGPTGRGRLLLMLRDITPRRKAEARNQELKDQLEHAQRLEAVGRLAGGVAHDFNNLLTAIGGGASFLADHHDSEVREIASELRAAQERGASLTRRLLSFARKEVTSPKVIDLAPFLERERQLLQRIVGERVVLDLDPSGAVPILLDEGQLEQVLLNLAVNARDAMSGHGTLYVGCKADGVHSVLTVRDTGCGMSDEVKRKVFEPFFTTKGVHGTGLGLSTVHGIVSSGGGTVEFDSTPGVGTEFRIRMPQAPEPVRADPSPAGGRTRRQPARILLVEDDDLTRDFARRALQRMGHTVEVARNGAEGLDRFGREGPFDLVLSDVTMPVMTGPELLARLRDQGATVPVLLMSGYVDDVLREGTFDVTTQLLLKPFSMDELSRRVDEAVRRPERAEDTRPG